MDANKSNIISTNRFASLIAATEKEEDISPQNDSTSKDFFIYKILSPIDANYCAFLYCNIFTYVYIF